MSYRVTYYIGKYDKETFKQELSNEYFKNTITSLLGECTIIEVSGTYVNSKNKVVKAPNLKVETIVDDDFKYIRSNAINNCQVFKRKFNQESILLTIEEIEYEVI